jgi:transcriptional regulator with XRE-family HTH domain
MLNKIPTASLAKFLDVNPSFVSNIKAGKKRLPPKDLERVSKEFGIPITDLVKIYQKGDAT